MLVDRKSFALEGSWWQLPLRSATQAALEKQWRENKLISRSLVSHQNVLGFFQTCCQFFWICRIRIQVTLDILLFFLSKPPDSLFWPNWSKRKWSVQMLQWSPVIVVNPKLASFRLDYEYEIEYEYDFPTSNQWRFQSPCSSCWF